MNERERVEAEIIYGLTTPDGVIRYVGRTRLPYERYQQHLRDAAKAVRVVRETGGDFLVPTPKEYWITSLHHEGKRPDMVVLERCHHSEARRREDYWIKHFVSRGHYLTNTKSPRGCPKLNEDWFAFWRERRAKVLQKNKRKFLAEYRRSQQDFQST